MSVNHWNEQIRLKIRQKHWKKIVLEVPNYGKYISVHIATYSLIRKLSTLWFLGWFLTVLCLYIWWVKYEKNETFPGNQKKRNWTLKHIEYFGILKYKLWRFVFMKSTPGLNLSWLVDLFSFVFHKNYQ